MMYYRSCSRLLRFPSLWLRSFTGRSWWPRANRSARTSRETTAGANCLLKKENETRARALVYHALTHVYSQRRTFHGNRGDEVRMQKSEKQGWEWLFFPPRFVLPPPPALSVGYSVIMSAATLGMLLFLPSRSSLCFLSPSNLELGQRSSSISHLHP